MSKSVSNVETEFYGTVIRTILLRKTLEETDSKALGLRLWARDDRWQLLMVSNEGNML